jgi:hypothetical protein
MPHPHHFAPHHRGEIPIQRIPAPLAIAEDINRIEGDNYRDGGERPEQNPKL